MKIKRGNLPVDLPPICRQKDKRGIEQEEM
jgi:hypothetical protein